MNATPTRTPYQTVSELTTVLTTTTDAWIKEKGASLITFWNARGWSAAQIGFAEKLIAKAKAPAAAPAGIAVTNDMAGVIALFDRGRSKIKWPKVRLLCTTAASSIPITLSVAGPTARFPGSINVMTGYTAEQRDWIGRVHLDGRFDPKRSLDAAFQPYLVALLIALAADPVKVATDHGKLTGHCCFCNLPLTDAKSTAVGYGKTCAGKWSLPY